MSFVGRWWRALDAQYDIADSWPVTFTTLTLSLLLSLPSLLYYTYTSEDAEQSNYYDFPYSSHWYPLSSDGLHSYQLWRLLTSQLVWSSASELVLGSALLLLVRVVEDRVTASVGRTAAVLLVVMAACVGYGAGIALGSGGSVYCASGPYWLCFFLLPLYLLFHPSSSHVKLWSLSLSNKLVAALVGLQLMLFLLPPSVLSAAAPIALALLYAAFLWCSEGGFDRVTNPSRPQGMRVGRRGDPPSASGHRLGSATPPTASGHESRGGPRPASHYEKLLINAKSAGGGKAGSGGVVSPRRDAAEMAAGGPGTASVVRATEATGRPGAGASHEVTDNSDATLVISHSAARRTDTAHAAAAAVAGIAGNALIDRSLTPPSPAALSSSSLSVDDQSSPLLSGRHSEEDDSLGHV